jgi:hypothetical protein
MIISEIIDNLENAASYVEERVQVSDNLIRMVEITLPNAWDRIKEKELAYRKILKILEGKR